MSYRTGPSPKTVGLGVLGVLVVVVGIVLAFMSTITVGTGEIAVMTRFGEVTGQELGEGFHWKNPLDKANVYDVKVQKISADVAAASRDLQDVNATLVLNYRVRPGDVDDIHQNIGSDYQVKVIDPAVEEVFKAVSAQYNAPGLITQRSDVKADTQDMMAQRLASYGLDVTDISLTNFTFSEEFSNAIEQKQVAEQDAQRAQYRLDAARIDAEAQEVQAETLSPLYLQMQAIEKWDGELPLYMGGNGGEVLGIPMETITQGQSDK